MTFEPWLILVIRQHVFRVHSNMIFSIPITQIVQLQLTSFFQSVMEILYLVDPCLFLNFRQKVLYKLVSGSFLRKMLGTQYKPVGTQIRSLQHLNTLASGRNQGFSQKIHQNACGFAQEILWFCKHYQPGQKLKRCGKVL